MELLSLGTLRKIYFFFGGALLVVSAKKIFRKRSTSALKMFMLFFR